MYLNKLLRPAFSSRLREKTVNGAGFSILILKEFNVFY